MSRPQNNLLRKIFFIIAGREHRDYASSYSLVTTMESAFNHNRLRAENCLFGFEKSFKNMGMDDDFHLLIKKRGMSIFGLAVESACSNMAKEHRLQIIDTITIRYLRSFCDNFKIRHCQLDSDKIMAEIEAKA